jgi:acetyl esterase/lipase
VANRTLELALSRSALVISPDYRLVPEANGTDILADVERFSVWMKDELPAIAHRESWHASPDLNCVASLGQSGGAFLAPHSTLLPEWAIDIKVVVCISGTLDTNAPLKLGVPLPRVIMGTRPPPPRQAEALIRDYIRNIEPGAVRTKGDPIDMWPLLICIVQQAWLPRLLGVKANPHLQLMARLEQMKSIPPLWIIHGKEDSIVSQLSSRFCLYFHPKLTSSDSRRVLNTIRRNSQGQIPRASIVGFDRARRSRIHLGFEHERALDRSGM